MKKIFILSLICVNAAAQIPNNTNSKFLDKNNVKARINTANNKFWDIYGNGKASYEVPKGQGVHAVFANNLWIGGLDVGGQLHIAANTYKQTGTDFFPGPLDTINPASYNAGNTAAYNTLWKIDCNDINNFVTAFNNGSVANNTYAIPNDILNYPGNGIGNFQKQLSPFFDANGDGIYNPQSHGDYPIIKGQQQVLSIFNDKLGPHTESGGVSMGIEVHESSYAYFEPTIHDSMQAINLTTFYRYTIYNRSSTNYYNVHITDWNDVDLGNYTNDYIGTDTINDFTYAYNAGNYDATANGVNGYHARPPVLSHAFINTNCSSDGIDNDNDGVIDEAGEQFEMNKTTYYNNNISAFPPSTTNPDIAVHYYNYMSGFWKDGTPFTQGGNAFAGTTPVNYIYPGDPQNNTGWTEVSAANLAGDRRILMTSGPFNFPAGSKIEWGYAIIFSQDTTAGVNTISQFNTRVKRDVKNARYYDQQHQAPQCAPVINVGIKETEKDPLKGMIYPNPASNLINIDLSANVKNADVKLFDITGRMITQTKITDGYRAQLDITLYDSGIYLIEVTSNGKKLTQKIVKN